MAVHVIADAGRLDTFVALLATHHMLCVHRATRHFMDSATPLLLRAGYAYVYVEDGAAGVCTAWDAAKFEAVACRTVVLRHTPRAPTPLWARVLPFLASPPATVTHRALWVRLRQANTSREVCVVTVHVPCSTDVDVAEDLSRQLEALTPDGDQCVVVGELGSCTTRDELARGAWRDACRDTPGTVTVLYKGLIQFRGTPGGGGVHAQFY